MVLYEKDSDKIVSIASLTKIMTTIVAIENIDDFNETVYITYDMLKDVPWDSSVAGLSIGDEVTYLDLLYASILPSGADATNSLAISLTGSIDNFVDMMNDKAQELNLFDTHFSNTTGYDIDNHYSTANDILKLLVYSLSNQTFKKIYTTNKYTFQTKGDANNTADFTLAEDTNIIGEVIFKIPKIGYIQSILATKGGLIIVVLIPCLAILSYDIVKLGKNVKNKVVKKKSEVSIVRR